MSLMKSEVKVETVNDLGNRLDDMKEANEKDLYRLEGAIQAFQAMSQAIEALLKVVDQEMDEGKFDLEVAPHIKRYIQRANQMAINLGMKSENNRFMQMGKIQAMEQAVAIAAKMREEEMAKIATLAAALEAAKAKANGQPVNLADVAAEVGRPRQMSLKEQRLAEEAAEKASEAAKVNGESVAQTEVTASGEGVTEASPAEGNPDAVGTSEAEEPKAAKKPPVSKGKWAPKSKRA